MAYSSIADKLPTTKEVLAGHLTAKIKEVYPDGSAEPLTNLIIASTDIEEILTLLKDEKALVKKVENLKKLSAMSISNGFIVENSHTCESIPKAMEDANKVQTPNFKETNEAKNLSEEQIELGEQLFSKVAEIESELCAQLTGMILEANLDDVKEVIDNKQKLEVTISKAKTEYLAKFHPAYLPKKEEIGEGLYEKISERYPQEAARITGMLLEMDMVSLQHLLINDDALNEKIELALHIIQEIK